MNGARYKKHRRMLGTTLIGLMIGLLVSVIGILASLTLYRSLIAVSTESKVDALHDGQLATTLLAIQLKIQNAGFGLFSNAANIVIDQNVNVKNIYWRYKIDDVVMCEGIKKYSKNIASGPALAIDFIAAAAGACDQSSSLKSMAWQPVSTVAVFPRQATATVDFNLAQKTCSPYGVGEAGPYYVFVLTGKTAANVAGSSVGGVPIKDVEMALCLPNIRSS